MSSFTPRSWKSHAETQGERPAAPPVEPLPPPAEVESNNLPITRTAFIGRKQDVADIKALLKEYGLVTLVGSGGVGKTRLAVHVGAQLVSEYANGVWLVDLAPIADPELVSSVIAQTLGISQQEGRRVDESIPPWLKRKQLLLILDNCEHVLQTVGGIAAAILRTAANVRILATSRQPLGIAGEKVSRLESLDVPRSVIDCTAQAIINFGAVALFVDRASLADKTFALTDDTAPIIGDICRRLDGIPLAIELAAARVKVLSIAHLAERLNERFKLLTGGSSDALPRQKTLHALLDWSYDLLTPNEQRLFTRLGIFAGGFTLDAATRVCGGGGLDELDILDLLGSLTDKSLVVADTSGERERYRLLESTAAYALEKLRACGERETLARRHAEYYRELAEAAAERFVTEPRAAWLAGVELELDNYRSALTWALTQDNDTVLGGIIAGELSSLWSNVGLAVEGRYWIERALERVSEGEQPRVAAQLQYALSGLVSGKRMYDAAERAMQLYTTVGDARRAARSRVSRAFALIQMGELNAAHVEIEQALAALRACGDVSRIPNALSTQALIETYRGDLGAAREGYEKSLAGSKALGDEDGSATVMINIAELEFADGHPDQALRWVSDALAIHLRGKNMAAIANDYVNGAAYRIALGDLGGARNSAREGLRVAREAGYEIGTFIALQHLALLLALGGDGRRAAHLLGYVDACYTGFALKREPTEQWSYDRALGALRQTLREEEIAQLSTDGATWSADRAVDEALKE